MVCPGPYGAGGIGQLLATVVEELRTAGRLSCYLTTAGKANDPLAVPVSLEPFRWLLRRTPLRWSWRARKTLASILFDRQAARRLPPGEDLIAFSGQARATFRRARRLGYSRLVLESPAAHITHVWRRHRAATSAYPIERSWPSRWMVRRILHEYEQADEIVVLSEHSFQSFLAAGVPAEKLHRRILRASPRFAPPARREPHRGFRIVYVGRLQVTKGIGVLLDALTRIPEPDVELVLCGSTASKAMDRYLEQRRRRDPRIVIDFDDPLPHLHRADVLVHPSYEEGLALAPLEALATGLPVIVTEDTPMKEYVIAGQNGFVVPTGDIDQLVAAIARVRAHPRVDRFVAPR